MNKDIKHWVRTCIHCQRGKVHQHTTSPIGHFKPPDTRFSHVHIDLVGPLPSCRGFTHLLTCVDRFTRWPEAIPLKNTSSDTIVRKFFDRWVTHFGCPTTITTDRGAQFESLLFTRLTNLLGSTRIRTTAYHPAANGMVERFHRQLKAALSTHDPARWVDALPVVLLGIRTALKTDLDCSAAELVYGTTLRLPGDLIAPNSTNQFPSPDFVSELTDRLRNLRPTSPRIPQRKTYIPPGLKSSSQVFVRHDAIRKPLQPPYDGPFKVLRRHDKHYTISRNGKDDTVSIDRLKPAFIDSDPPSTDWPTPSFSSCPVPLARPLPAPTPLVDHSPSFAPPESPKSILRPSSSDIIERTRSGRVVRIPKRLQEYAT